MSTATIAHGHLQCTCIRDTAVIHCMSTLLQLKVLMKEFIEDVKSGGIVLGDTLEAALELGEKHEAFVTKCKTVRFCLLILYIIDIFLLLCLLSLYLSSFPLSLSLSLSL